MKAVILTKPTESTEIKITECPTPAIKPGWVLVRIKAFGMNHSEQILRKSEISAPNEQKRTESDCPHGRHGTRV